MKVFLAVLFAIVAGFLWLDNNSKRTGLNAANSALALSQKQQTEQADQINQLQQLQKAQIAQITQLQQQALVLAQQNTKLTAVSPTPAPSPTPNWIQKRVEDNPAKLDLPPSPVPYRTYPHYWIDQYGQRHYTN